MEEEEDQGNNMSQKSVSSNMQGKQEGNDILGNTTGNNENTTPSNNNAQPAKPNPQDIDPIKSDDQLQVIIEHWVKNAVQYDYDYPNFLKNIKKAGLDKKEGVKSILSPNWFTLDFQKRFPTKTLTEIDLEILDALARWAGIDDPSKTEEGAKQDFRFLERTKLVDQKALFKSKWDTEKFKFDFIWDAIPQNEFEETKQSNYNAFKTKSLKNQEWKLFSICGASGIGKTRLSFELAKRILDQEKYAVDIYAKQNNGSSWDLKIPPINYIAKLFLEQLFGFSDSTLSWSNETVMELLEKYRILRKIPQEEVLHITFRIDEIQKFVYAESGKDLERRQTSIYKFSVALMELCITFSRVNIFMIPIMSGTLPLSKIELFPKTEFRVKGLFLSPINVEESIKLVKHELKKVNIHQSPLFQENYLELLLKSCGPNPRILEEIIIPTIIEHPEWPIEKIYASARSILQPTEPMKKELVENLLYHLFCNPSPTIQDLESLLWVGIVSIVDNRVFLPMIYADVYLKDRTDLTFITELFSIEHFPSSRDLETLPLKFFALKQNLFLKRFENSVSAKKFFLGVDSNLNDELKLNLGETPMNYYQSLQETIPTERSSPILIQSTPSMTVTRTAPSAIWVGKKWSPGDGFIQFPNALVITQSKSFWTLKGQPAAGKSDDTLQISSKKALNSEFKPDYFLYCTNAPLSEIKTRSYLQNAKKPTLVISARNWDQVFTHLLWKYKSPKGNLKGRTGKKSSDKTNNTPSDSSSSQMKRSFSTYLNAMPPKMGPRGCSFSLTWHSPRWNIPQSRRMHLIHKIL